jgi:valyl-tRNA synthetase
VLAGADEAAKVETRATAAHVLALLLKLLHPFMPYITEALWARFGGERGRVLALSRWPRPDFADLQAADDINWLVELVGALRSVRSEMNVPNSARTPLVLVGGAAELAGKLQRHAAALGWMARVDDIVSAGKAPPGSAQVIVGGASFALPLAGIIDFGAEESRLEKEIARVTGEIARIDKKLANENFLSRAPEEVVEAEREKRASYAADGERLSAALKRVKEAA